MRGESSLAAVGYAVGPMLLKRRFGGLDPRALDGREPGDRRAAPHAGRASLAPPDATPSADALLALVVLGLVCTAIAFVVFGFLIAEVGPGRAA